MHMHNCPCGGSSCYCCGRTAAECVPFRGPTRRCDRNGIYLENKPGWNGFALRDENAGQGALHEFHRRRAAYFLRLVKENTAPALWAQLRAARPRLLEGTPTHGRRIAWDEIDRAELPLFGDTRRGDLPPPPRFEVVSDPGAGVGGGAAAANEEALDRLEHMGFPRAACARALEAVRACSFASTHCFDQRP